MKRIQKILCIAILLINLLLILIPQFCFYYGLVLFEYKTPLEIVPMFFYNLGLLSSSAYILVYLTEHK